MLKFLLGSTAAVAVVALAVQLAGAAGGRPSPKDLVGKAAPDFTLKTLDGKEAKLSEQKGNVVLVDFWATWCPPCRKSLPHVQELSANADLAKKGLKVWAVNAREGKEKVEQFVKENKYTFTVPMDSEGATMGDYLVSGIPTTVVIGRDGLVKAVFVGYGAGTGEAIDKAVNEALAQKAK